MTSKREAELEELAAAESNPLTDKLCLMINPPIESVVTIRTGQLPAAVVQAESTLLKMAEQFAIFQRAGELVRIARLPELRTSGGLRRPAGTVLLVPLTAIALVDIFEASATFQRFNKKGEPYTTDCPMRLASTYMTRVGLWRLPALAGIVTAPLLRPDGSVLATPGYDWATGLFFLSEENWPKVPESPTREDAKNALATLMAPFSQFPFCVPADRGVLAAALLTGIQRRVLAACPLFAFTAPTQRSGKSLLAESVAIVTTGKPAAATGVSSKGEELRKAITSILCEGHSVVNLDNIVDVFSSPDLARALTQSEYGDRLLGETQTLHLPTNVLWTASGNNLIVKGDLTSRTLLCRIDAGVERPEQRNFVIPDLKNHLTEHRTELVTAALTILRAFYVAGSPQQNVTPWGGFDFWSKEIREPLIWAGMADPCQTREVISADDPEIEEARVTLYALHEAFGINSFTVAEVIQLAGKPVAEVAGLRTAILTVAHGRSHIPVSRLIRTWKR